MLNNLLAVLNGLENGLGDGAYVSVVAIALVFIILALIIAITYCVNLIIQKGEKPTVKNDSASAQTSASLAPVAVAVPTVTKRQITSIDSDLDASVAVLIASIDYRNEVKDDVKVKSVYEIIENKPEQAVVMNNDNLDDNAMTAVLVASIDYRNEIKQDIKVKSIKEIK